MVTAVFSSFDVLDEVILIRSLFHWIELKIEAIR